jgi:hypothetical protein
MSADHDARQTTVLGAGERPAKDWASADFAQLRRRIHGLVDDLMRGVLGAFVNASPAEIGELIKSVGQIRGPERADWRFGQGANAANGAAPSLDASRSRLEGELGASVARSPLMGAAERTSPPKRNAAQRLAMRNSAHREIGSFDRLEERPEDKRRETRSTAAHNPFDITSPGELLASVGTRTPPGESSEGTASKFDYASRGIEGAPEAAAVEASKPAELPAILTEPTKRRPVDSPASSSDQEAPSERRPRVVLREGERLLSATGSGVVIRRARR